LTELHLSSNQLTTLPESLGQLTQLTGLDLSNNQLTILPDSLGQLTQLQSLNLSNNQLTILPDSLGRLTQLQSLDISKNLLTVLPDSLDNLRQLKRLYLGTAFFDSPSGNPLGYIPEFVRNLKQLDDFAAWYCDLTLLPEWIEELPKLRALGLGRNNLREIPTAIGNITGLEVLWLDGNQLTDLPTSLTKNARLERFDISENPLNPELAEAYKQGIDGIKAYLRAKVEGGQIILNEAKLILVGEGEVGKTCLMDALLDKDWQEHPSTHGIEIQPVKVTDSKSKTELTLNGWDFGGQRVYRPTHQLFFSAPAVYLVVWKPREGPQQGFVKEWIQLIKRREPTAKILVVATHGGPKQRQPDIDRQEFWDVFGKDTIIDFFHIESKPDKKGNRRGIKDLKKAIAQIAVNLPEVGRSVPKNWQDVRDALAKTKKAYLPLDDVIKICRKHKMDNEQANLFVTIEHRLGHLIHYQHDPILRDIVVLKPDWLATAISFVLDDEETRKNNGLVHFSRLGQLWSDPKRSKTNRYSATLHKIFVRLMERFDLCYRVAGITSKDDADPGYLIAQLVPDIRPENLENAWSSSLAQGDLQQTQICRIVDKQTGLTASAEGLFYQLIVRLHKYSLGRLNYHDSIHWQRGLVLDNAYNGRAFLEHKGNDIHITVRAPYPQGFLTMLTEEVRFLVESFWEGLRCEVTVPCLNPTPCKGLFEVSKLIENKKQNRIEQPCPICNYWQNIDSLLLNAPVATKLVSEDKLYAELIKVKDEIYTIRPALEKQQGEVLNRFTDVSTDIQRLFSQAETNLNIILQALADEAKEGPRLFSLVPVHRDKFDPRGWTTARFQLTLWCEHSHLPLTALNVDKTIGVYQFDLTREWVKKYSPLVKAFTITLKSFLPVAFAAAKLAIDATLYKEIENELDFSKAYIDALISEGEGVSGLFTEGAIGDEPMDLPLGKRINPQDANLREFHALLNQVDPTRKYGNLVKVTNKQQKFLWVHVKYASEY
jgi:Leucine-rich repeat (LRR) protein